MARTVWVAWCLALGSVLSAGMAGQAGSRPATQPTTRLSAARVAGLVEQLGHRQWAVRHQATAKLKRGGLELLDPLAAAYKTHKAGEIRLRIKEIVEHIVMTSELSRAGGFLGVRQRLITRADDLRIPEGQTGVTIAEVLPDTAAAAAGIAAGDVILAMDGAPFKAGLNADDFRKRIASLAEGTRIELTILRGDKKMRITATLGRRPMAYTDEGSQEFVRVQARFARLWRARFDPNDQNVVSRTLERPWRQRGQGEGDERLLDLLRPKEAPAKE